MSGIFDFYKGVEKADEIKDFGEIKDSNNVNIAEAAFRTASDSFKSSYNIADNGRMAAGGSAAGQEATAAAEEGYTFTSTLEYFPYKEIFPFSFLVYNFFCALLIGCYYKNN